MHNRGYSEAFRIPLKAVRSGSKGLANSLALQLHDFFTVDYWH